MSFKLLLCLAIPLYLLRISPPLWKDVAYHFVVSVGALSKYVLVNGCYGAIGLAITMATVPFALGFTPGGIAAGSCAAAMMAWYGGYVPIGSFVAIMQSVGSMGIRAGCNPFTLTIGCIMGMVYGCYWALKVDNVFSEFSNML